MALKVLSGLGPGAEGHLARFRREAELAYPGPYQRIRERSCCTDRACAGKSWRGPTASPGARSLLNVTVRFPAGTIVTSTQVKTKEWRKTLLASIELDMVSGKNVTSLALHEVYTVIVTTDARYEGQYCELMRLTNNLNGIEYRDRLGLNAKGEYHWDGVVAGEYAVRTVGNSGTETMYVSVPTSGPVDFTPSIVKRLRILWSEMTTSRESLGLERGDTIVEVAGKAVADIPTPQRALMLRAAEEKDGALVVERKGRRLSLILDSAKLRAATMEGHLVLPAP